MHIHIGHMFFGAGNLGDDLVLDGFLKGIAGARPGLRLTCATPYDIVSQRRRFPQIEWSVHSPETRDALTAACDVWLGLGGSVLQGLSDHWLLADQLVQLQECRRRDKPVFFLGCSIDYRTDAQRPDIRFLLDSANWIWTREALSTESLHRMGFTRAATGADLSHLALRGLPPARLDADSTGFVCNFELASQYSIEALSALIGASAGAGRNVPWLVQEVRTLAGSELDLYGRLPPGVRQSLDLRQPDYQAGAATELVRCWGRPTRLFSSRFHGVIIGAWLGSRVVAFERQQKLRGIAQALGVEAFAALPDPSRLAQAFDRARPVPHSVLQDAAALAQRVCTDFLKAAAASARPRFGGEGSMTTPPPSAPVEQPAAIVLVDEDAAAIDHFIAAADRFRALHHAYRQAPDGPRLEQLRQTRDAAIYALLGLPGSVIRTRLAGPVTLLLTAVLESGVRHLERTAEEEATFVECCRRLGLGWGEDAGFVYGLAALALSGHGNELVTLQPLAQDLGWAEPFWLECLLVAPPGFLRPGDADRFADLLAPLMGQLLERLDRTEPGARLPLVKAFFASDLFKQACFNERNMRAAMIARARIIERLLTFEGARLDQLMVRQPSRRRPRIGFITLAVQDRPESAFLLAHLEHLARQHLEIRLYCLDDPEGRIGALCRNAALGYRRLPESIVASVTLLRGEDLDIAVFATNLAAKPNAAVLAAAHRVARVQATATWTPLTSGLRHIDVMISGEHGEVPGAEAQYAERLIRLPGAHTCFPFHPMIEGQTATTTVSRGSLGIPDTAPVYISAACGAEILPELSRAWIEILAQVPDSYLVLLPFNSDGSRRYDRQSLLRRIGRQVQEAGLGTDRLRVIDALPTIADLHQVLGAGDIYLDSFPYSGAGSICDPIAVGLPIVARAGETSRSRQSYAMLREIGLEDWVTFGEAEYIERAVRLGRDRDYLEGEAIRLAEVTAGSRPFTDTARYAAKLAPALTGLIAEWDRRSAELLAMSETTRADRITLLSTCIATLRPRFSGLDLLEEVVVPYLRHGLKRRFIHIGGGFEATGRSLIDDNWLGVLLGPDGRPAPLPGSIAAQAGALPDIGMAQQIELANFNDADLIQIDAGGNDFALLAALNFGTMTPRLIMVSFDTLLPGQDAAAIATTLHGMQVNGYRAAVFGFAPDAGTGLTRLAGISIDRMPAPPQTGTILFFRAADDGFLPSLLGWLEDVCGARAADAGEDAGSFALPGAKRTAN